MSADNETALHVLTVNSQTAQQSAKTNIIGGQNSSQLGGHWTMQHHFAARANGLPRGHLRKKPMLPANVVAGTCRR